MLKNSFYNVVGAVIRLGLLVLTVPLLVHLIGVDEYGLWSLVSAAVGLVGLAEAGLTIATTVFVSRDLANDDLIGVSQTLTITCFAMVVLATFAALFLWFGSPMLVKLFPNLSVAQRIVATKSFQLGGLAVWARLIQQIFVGLEQAYQRYGILNILNTVQATLLTLGLWVVASSGGRTLEMARWQALATAVMLVAHIAVGRVLTRKVALRPMWSGVKGRAIARYTVMTMVGSLSGALFSQCDRLVVGALLGTQTLGIYAAITNIAVQINSFSALLVQPILPILSKLLATVDRDQRLLLQRVKQASQLNAIAALGAGAALFTFTPSVIRLMIPGTLGSDYITAFRIAAIIYGLFSINAVAYFMLLGTDGVAVCMLLQLISAVLSLLLIAGGASLFGLLGAIIGNVGSFVTLLALSFGMKRVGVVVQVWASWLLIPLSWFVTIIVVNIFLPELVVVKIVVFGVEILPLLIWLGFVYRLNLKMVFENIYDRQARMSE